MDAESIDMQDEESSEQRRKVAEMLANGEEAIHDEHQDHSYSQSL